MDEKKVLQLKLEEILPNRFQPRLRFDEVAINELSESIKKHGVIQPIVVRPIGDKYEIIAGERRFKASQLAGKNTIPAIIADLDDKNSAEVALIENVQREDLTPIEEAVSYKKILDMGYLTQTELATKLGKEQSTIANKLRLLNLHEEVQDALLDEEISERHARSLLKLDKERQRQMLKNIIEKRLTVRKTDQEIEKMLNIKEEDPEIITFDFIEEENEETNMNENINPGFIDIDKIEQEAQDIYVEKKEPKIEDFFNTPVPEKEIEEQFTPRKFFNFFPDENMEDDLERPEVDKLFNFELQKETKEEPKKEQSAEEENGISELPVFNFSSFDNAENEQDKVNYSEDDKENNEAEVSKIENSSFDFDKFTIPEIDFETEEAIVEPSLVEEISDNNNIEKKSVMNVVKKLRDCANEIEAMGFVLETDEFDFEDTYQIIIKINKE